MKEDQEKYAIYLRAAYSTEEILKAKIDSY